jgi:inositol-phosphate phosphatase / L-galactose 1-phosphate phosphatase / histidinol-phosphatase
MTIEKIPPSLFQFAHQLADQSGDIVRRYFRTQVAVDDKADQSPVTIADREIEQLMRQEISRYFPTHGIYGEEFGSTQLDAEWIWVIDPIDGTKSFITGKPLFGTLIALLYRQRPVLGILDQAFLRERWCGAVGQETTFNAQAVRTRVCPELAQATLYATSPLIFTEKSRPLFEKLQTKVKMSVFGGDCYAYGLLANGFVDLVVEDTLKPYDYCALIPIIEQAGGIISDWQGNALNLHSNGQVIAAGNIHCYQQALDVLNV